MAGEEQVFLGANDGQMPSEQAGCSMGFHCFHGNIKMYFQTLSSSARLASSLKILEEPAEEPDPQEDPEDQAPEVPEALEATAEASLSKRQRQRLRQRQPKVGSGATKPATKAEKVEKVEKNEKVEKAEKAEKAEAFPKSSSGTSESLRLTNSKDLLCQNLKFQNVCVVLIVFS